MGFTGRCQICGREAPLATHHLIPRWLGGEDGDTREVCNPCHRHLEKMIDRFIKWGDFERHHWLNPDKKNQNAKQYRKRCERQRYLFIKNMAPLAQYRDVCMINLNTGHVHVTHSWAWNGHKRRN